jgi:hypothetical protein
MTDSQTPTSATRPATVRVFMFDVSLATATFWYDAFNVILFLGAFAVAVGTYGSVRMGAIKERFADERISENETATSKAIAESDAAKRGAAEANARALEAQLALEKFKAPRLLLPEQQKEVAQKMRLWTTLKGGEKQSAAVFAVDSSFESAALADQIAVALGPSGAGFSINRHPVMYGKAYNVSGVGMLTSSNPRGIEVANSLASALRSVGITAFVLSEKRSGCEEVGPHIRTM